MQNHDVVIDTEGLQGPQLSSLGLKSFDEEYSNEGSVRFIKRLQCILSRDRLQDGELFKLNIFPICANSTPLKAIPTLFSDVIKRMDGWGDSGKINPFDDIYYIVFQITVRMATCRELAEDSTAVDQLFGLFWKLQKSATPVGVLLPWFPSKAKRDKNQANADLYNFLSGYIDSRRSAQESGSDAIDLLIAQGVHNTAITGVSRSHVLFAGSLINLFQFVNNVIFAGIANTGIMCACLVNSRWANG